MSRERDRATALGLIHEQPSKKLHLVPPPTRPRTPSLLRRVWRRLFSAPTWPACDSGPCQRGTKLCPSPEACRLAERSKR